MSLSFKHVILLATGWCVTIGIAYYAGSALTESVPAGIADATGNAGGRSPRTEAGAVNVRAQETAAIMEEAVEDETAEVRDGQMMSLSRALSDYLANPGDRAARQQLSLMIQGLGPGEISGALEKIQDMPAGSNRDRLLVELVGQWAAYNPQAAIAYAQTLPNIRLSSYAMREALQGWGRTDPQSAIAWWASDANPVSSRVSGDQMRSIMRGYVDLDPYGAFQYVAAMSEDSLDGRRLKNRAIETVVDAMIDQGRLADAISWTNQLPEGEAQTSALSEIFEDWTRYDPDAAVDYLSTLTDREDYGELRSTLLRSWTRTDPAQVAEYISSMDSSDPQLGRMTAMLVATWGRYDLAAAGEWLNTQPASEETDRAVAMFTYQAASEDPAGAMTWAESIGDERMKGRLMRRVASEWKAQDPEGFEQYLDSSEITDEQKTELQGVEPSSSQNRGRWWGRR